MCRIRPRPPAPTQIPLPPKSPLRPHHAPNAPKQALARILPASVASHPPSRRLGGHHPVPIRGTATPAPQLGGLRQMAKRMLEKSRSPRQPETAPSIRQSEGKAGWKGTPSPVSPFLTSQIPFPLPPRKRSSPTPVTCKGQQLETQEISKNRTVLVWVFFSLFPPKKTQDFPRKSSINMRIAAGGGRSRPCPSARGEFKKKHQKKKNKKREADVAKSSVKASNHFLFSLQNQNRLCECPQRCRTRITGPSMGWGERDGVPTGMRAKPGCQPLQEEDHIPAPYAAIALRPEKTTERGKNNIKSIIFLK